jgi:glutamine amidotransferase-like uncharacterized protein
VPTSIVALFKHHPECSRDSCNGIEQALDKEYHVKYFDEKDDLDAVLQDATVVAFPGGIGDADRYYDFFKRRAANTIADFVESGGHYLGICMGAYWAGSHYFDILNGVDAVQYIKRPYADIRRSYGTVAPVMWRGQPHDMYFYDGCALVGDESRFTTVARYANGDPMAIIQNRIGVIGCHPESLQYWYEKDWQYINQYWHRGQHHSLLLDFVKDLTS